MLRIAQLVNILIFASSDLSSSDDSFEESQWVGSELIGSYDEPQIGARCHKKLKYLVFFVYSMKTILQILVLNNLTFETVQREEENSYLQNKIHFETSDWN